MIRLPTLFSIALLASSGVAAAQAAPIHKWVDEKGVTHYSDQAPSATTISATQLDVDTRAVTENAPAGKPDDYYSIANQWQRMDRERQLREQRELQRAALSIEAQASRNPVPQYSEPEKKYQAVIYPRRWHRRHGHKHRQHRGHVGMNVKQPPVRGVSSGFPSVIN